MTVTAPPLETQGRVPISLTCRTSAVVDAIEGYVQYQAFPSVSATSTEGVCEALKECSFLVTIANPPDNVRILDNVKLSISGGKFASRPGDSDAGAGGIRASFVAVSSAELIIRIQTPVALVACNLTCEYLRPGRKSLYACPTTLLRHICMWNSCEYCDAAHVRKVYTVKYRRSCRLLLTHRRLLFAQR
jgi:hypothetical protein